MAFLPQISNRHVTLFGCKEAASNRVEPRSHEEKGPSAEFG